jgi:hypothetical protein
MSHNLTGNAGVIEGVYEGMTVVDAAGNEIGKVAYVQMGDPEAVTIDGNRPRGTGLLGDLAQAFDPNAKPEPEVAEPLWSELTRIGFIKVDGPGLFEADRYVRADLLESVSNDTGEDSA